MRRKPSTNLPKLVSFLFLISNFSPLWAIDIHEMVAELLPKDQLPRVLNSEDIHINPNDPQPIFSPDGDFNKDGITDVAISGIYTLPKGPKKYFLLVGTQRSNPIRYEKMFFQEYADPVFLHKPGTTGEKDSGEQAFSITFCSNCSDGFDFFWVENSRNFLVRTWEKRIRRYQELPHAPELDIVSPETADAALKIVGELKDVQVFVAGVKKKGGALGTQVERRNIKDPPEVLNVIVFEKRKKKLVYDTITVNTALGTVVDRKRKIKLGKP